MGVLTGIIISITVNMIVVSLLLISVASVLSQITPPVFNKIGCPKPETWPFKGENNCFVGSTACIRDWGYIKDNPKPLVDIGDLRRNNNVYRIIRARSWWFCGRACDPTTPCKYWTYRHGMRRCYLLKSCCEIPAQGYTSGTNKCPGYDD